MKQTQANGQISMSKPNLFRRMLAQWDLQILAIPGLILLLVFSYFPMYGLVMAFQEYRMGDFPGMSEWVGFKQFSSLFNDPNFFRTLRNTLAISGLKLSIGFFVPVVFAVIINEMQIPSVKKVIQTVSYLPHFISWTVTATLMFDFLAVDGGAVNEMLLNFGLISEPIRFFQKGEYFWGLALGTDIWKEAGWGTIIYISAMAGVDAEIYEAADIDGATRLQKIWHITIKAIKPTIILLFIMQVGGIMNSNFDQIMMLTNQMGNALLTNYADVIDTYTYRMGLTLGRFSYATASGFFKAVINFGLLLFANWIADKAGENALF